MINFKSTCLNKPTNQVKILKINELIEYQAFLIKKSNKAMENHDNPFDCKNVLITRIQEMFSWSIISLELIDEIILMYEDTNYPVYDMGCGRGLMVILLNYLNVPTFGFDNGQDSNVDKLPIFKDAVVDLISHFGIPWCGDDKFFFKDINTITSLKKGKTSMDRRLMKCKYIFFQSWGRTSQAVDNYVHNGGEYIIIVGEGQDGSTNPGYDHALKKFRSVLVKYIDLLSFKFVNDKASVNKIKN